MKYQVIARRYRPRRFDEVVGQESIAETLRGAITQDRIAHAYLFTGPRGVGKTSMARIFAKALDCPQAADASRSPEERGIPCDKCFTCEAIHTGQDIDVVELDGASHRGIEDIRTIIEGIHRPPTRGPFKIYIIDEVHMLTREAFNALLKTLEEPPPHVKFVFATTEAHRIPDTVLSRCQRFDFHPIGLEAITRRLAQICEAEGRKAEPGLLEKVARYSKGGLRDAQTLLDQLITVSDEVLSAADLDRVTGRIPQEAVGELTDAALASDAGSVLERARASFASGADPAIVIEQVIDGLRERLHAAVADPASGGGKAHLDRVMGALQVLLDVSSKLKGSPNAEASVEIALLKIARLEDPAAIEDVIRALLEIERREGARPAPPHAALPPGRGSPAPLPREGGPPPARRSPEIETPRPRTAPGPGRPGNDLRPQGGREASAGTGTVSAGEEPSASAATAVAAPDADIEAADPKALDFRSLLSVWGQIGIELESKHPEIAPIFREREPAPSAEPDLFALELSNDFYFRQMKSPQRLAAFLSIVREVARAPWRFRLEHAGKAIFSPVGGAPPPPSEPAPSRFAAAPGNGGGAGSARNGRLEAQAVEAAGPPAASAPGEGAAPGTRDAGLAKSPLVKKSLDLFNGRLV